VGDAIRQGVIQSPTRRSYGDGQHSPDLRRSFACSPENEHGACCRYQEQRSPGTAPDVFPRQNISKERGKHGFQTQPEPGAHAAGSLETPGKSGWGNESAGYRHGENATQVIGSQRSLLRLSFARDQRKEGATAVQEGRNGERTDTRTKLLDQGRAGTETCGGKYREPETAAKVDLAVGVHRGLVCIETSCGSSPPRNEIANTK